MRQPGVVAGNRQSSPSSFRRLAFQALVLTVATWLAHGGALRNDLVRWDDDVLLVDNENYRGLSPAHLRWMFTSFLAGHYQPLTWLSFAVDDALWGEFSAFGMHLTNLILHTLTVLGFWSVARAILKHARSNADENARLFAAWTAALLFAVHPLRVESVAWATERRDVLSGCLLMPAVYAYLRAVGTVGGRRAAWSVLATALYVLSLLSKAVGMTLPLVLLLLDIYPLRRWPGKDDPQHARRIRSLMQEKIPFVIPAVLTAFLAAHAQHQAGAMWETAAHPFSLRFMQAFWGLLFYPFKTVWPFGLIPLYEQPPDAQPLEASYAAALLIVVGIAALLTALRRRYPGVAMGATVYVVLIAPMLGMAQSGPQIVADRYSYLSCLPFALLIGGAFTRRTVAAHRGAEVVGRAAVALLVLFLIVRARTQTDIWRDSMTIWTHTLAIAPRTGVAHANLAVEYLRLEDWAAAQAHAAQALEILPGNRVAHLALARAARELGDLTAAQRHYDVARRIRPDDEATLTALIAVQLERHQHEEADELCQDWIARHPASPHAWFMRGTVRARQERIEEALDAWRRTIQLDPTYVEARLRSSTLLVRTERAAEAAALLENGLHIHPQDVRLLARLSWILATSRHEALRDGARARELAQRAISGDPGYPAAREALAAALAETGDFDAAIAALEQALADADRWSWGESLKIRWKQWLHTLRDHQPLREP